ncbi:Hypothetical predicted protein [Olea europaea subsp. europaea]|uniref:Uncharacterized protein n=1 Tax=Olea europaea subsp. europaea TaxID=158383 RepID=A0A8S0SCY6_OLEEU|nr:Hypothetical predicted protein [Olea europaea subsp. europaea]
MAVLPPLSHRSSSSRSLRPSAPLLPAMIMHDHEDFPGMPRRLSSTLPTVKRGGVQEEQLINESEAGEERLVLLLTRKLEKLRQDKARSQNEMEAENESMVLQLSKQLSALAHPSSFGDPASLQAQLHNNQQRNEHLEDQLKRSQHLNDQYKQELISLRARLGLSTSDPLLLTSSIAIPGVTTEGETTAGNTPFGSFGNHVAPPPSLATSFADVRHLNPMKVLAHD